MKKMNGETFTNKTLRTKLTEHYGDSIRFYTNSTQKTMVAFQNKTEEHLDVFYNEQRNTADQNEKERIITLAAKFILKDIRESKYKIADKYPKLEALGLDALIKQIPASLMCFLNNIIGENEKCKIIGIGQSLMQSAKNTDLMMPFPLYLSVHLHGRFGSKYLNDLMFQWTIRHQSLLKFTGLS